MRVDKALLWSAILAWMIPFVGSLPIQNSTNPNIIQIGLPQEHCNVKSSSRFNVNRVHKLISIRKVVFRLWPHLAYLAVAWLFSQLVRLSLICSRPY